MNHRTGFRTLLTTIALSAVLGATGPAGATHTLAAAHVPPPVAIGNEDLNLYVAVESSCIAFCGWIVATAHYTDLNGRQARVTTTVPHQQGAVVRLTVPGHDIRSYGYGPLGGFRYWIGVHQQDCAGPCHTATVRQPAGGRHGVVMVIGG